jgi:hypothetical protein
MLALGAASAAAFAKSRTMLALVLKRSRIDQLSCHIALEYGNVPSLVIPGFLGTPAGMRTISAPVKHSLSPDGVGSYPLTVLLVLMWLISAATPVNSHRQYSCLDSM